MGETDNYLSFLFGELVFPTTRCNEWNMDQLGDPCSFLFLTLFPSRTRCNEWNMGQMGDPSFWCLPGSAPFWQASDTLQLMRRRKVDFSSFSSLSLCTEWLVGHHIKLPRLPRAAQHICRRVIFFPFERTWRRYHSS